MSIFLLLVTIAIQYFQFEIFVGYHFLSFNIIIKQKKKWAAGQLSAGPLPPNKTHTHLYCLTIEPNQTIFPSPFLAHFETNTHTHPCCLRQKLKTNPNPPTHSSYSITKEKEGKRSTEGLRGLPVVDHFAGRLTRPPPSLHVFFFLSQSRSLSPSLTENSLFLAQGSRPR